MELEDGFFSLDNQTRSTWCISPPSVLTVIYNNSSKGNSVEIHQISDQLCTAIVLVYF